MGWVEQELKRQHFNTERSLRKQKKRVDRFRRRYLRKVAKFKNVKNPFEEYDQQDARTKKFIKKQLINHNGAVCAICGRPILDMKDCTIDHIKPRVRGGLTTIENCQLAHLDCNQAKDDAWYN